MAQTQEKHGVFGRIIKFLMVFIFFGIGASLITLGSICIAKNLDKVDGKSYRWLSIINIVFGSLLLTSPFFLNHKREGLSWIIKIIMTIIFVIFGASLIVANAIAIAKSWYPSDKWFPIINLVFGCLLFLSPFFLKKD